MTLVLTSTDYLEVQWRKMDNALLIKLTQEQAEKLFEQMMEKTK